VHADPTCEVLAGGGCDDSVGWFVEPTIVLGSDPCHDVFRTEYFGPLLAVYVYEDHDWDDVLALVDRGAAYALTGAVIGTDRAAIARASEALRFTAGNFYVNDRPTGAVVGQQPFGGGRASGTNDKAGSPLNLLRWTSPRSIKENLNPPTSSRYPHQG
jgi:1-pyrroline-5-carboxylate dehydrogenase